ncbi:MAG: preprotein translocase subunit YajC, partial [Candidatus Fonsibacter sp.]|nr:preprotein translocase subunit YajC [Candidatus Fonsibacter sp.]
IIRVIDDEKAELEVAENINVKIIKSTISQILSKTETK